MDIREYNQKFQAMKKSLPADPSLNMSKWVEAYRGLAQSVADVTFFSQELPILKRMRSGGPDDPVVTDPYMKRGVVVLRRFEKIFTHYFFQNIFIDYSALADELWCMKNCYESGIKTTKNPLEAANACRLAAQCGHVEAQYETGLFYETEEPPMQSYDLALSYYEKAADAGHVDAMYRTAMMYYHFGKGSQTVAWLKKAADAGHSDAEGALGICCDIGFGMTKNSEKAVAWYEKAAEKNDPFALLRLGMCYYYGDGVEEDKDQAAAYWKEAAENGSEEAEELLEYVL
ncbi:MAG TPA: hypothetical protein DIC18_04345 [Clostridiales bacterium]|nr:hypothetical protein [Clostridiales bacterium]